MAKRWIYNPRVIVPPVKGTNNWQEVNLDSKWVPNTEVPQRSWAQAALYRAAAMFPAVFSGVQVFTTAAGQNASIVTSAYKWLTSTLLAAQQQFNLRSYFQMFIIDESLQYNSLITLGTVPTVGASCQAPDGSLLAVGFGNNGINFWKASDASVAGNWNATLIVNSAGADILGNQAQVAMACSGYINGTYQIDVYYVSNVTNALGGGNLIVNHIQSTDGGATWHTGYTTQAVTFAFNSTAAFALAAGKPTRNADGTVTSIFFYTQTNTSSFHYTGLDIYYQLYTGSGVFGAGQIWNQRNVSTADFTIHSLDSEYINGTYYIVFAGLHNLLENVNTQLSLANANYSIYFTKILNLTGTSANDLWDKPVNIMPSISSQASNQNQFTVPRLSYDGTYLWLSFHGSVVDSVSSTAQGSSASVTTANSYQLIMQSADFVNFTYPTALADSSGNFFLGHSTGTIGNCGYDFVKNNSFYYLVGGGNIGAGSGNPRIWQLIKNSTTADVTNDVINYQIQENADQASAIAVTIGNQNGQWIGPAPTKTGASAIQKNRRISLFQGYYNASGTPEVAPRNDYFIDDIQQNITSNRNDFTLQGRDLYKKLLTTNSRYTYNLNGPIFYSDVFDGTTVSNWNFVSGPWAEVTAPTVNGLNVVGGAMTFASGSSTSTTDSVCILNGISTVPYGFTYAVTFQMPAAANTTPVLHFYGWYQDSNNWLRLEIQQIGGNNFTWQVVKNVGGSKIVMDTKASVSGNFAVGHEYYTIYIVKYDYYKFNFVLGSNAGTSTQGNDIQTFNEFATPGLGSATLNFANTTNGEYDITSAITSGSFTQAGAVGFGCNSYVPSFQYFKFVQYDNSNSIKDILQSIGVRAGIFNYKIQNVLEDYFFNPADYNGSFAITNRFLGIAAGNTAMNTRSYNQVKNGEIQFRAKAVPTNAANQYGLSLYFRAQLGTTPFQDGYEFNINVQNSGAFTEAAFYFWKSGTRYLITSSSPGVEYKNTAFSSPPVYVHDLNVDITQYHTYKLVFYDGWMFVFCEGQMLLAWNDNNTTFPYWTATSSDLAYWGFSANANTTLTVDNVQSSNFWKPVQTHSINPGDDMESNIQNVIDAIRGWFFSDLIGRLKAVLLSSADPVGYTYQNQLYTQVVDNSDKEYINQVTVYGLGVQATAQDSVSMGTNTKTRDAVIVDYSITTMSDAQTRAQNELTNFNKFNSQYSPTQAINVGSEIFDPVTIVNTGANSSNVQQNVRVYNQNISVGGQNTSSGFDIEIQTGQL